MAGCATDRERIEAIRPGNGDILIFNKPYDLVFKAAARVLNQNKLKIPESDPGKGRIVAVGGLWSTGIFLSRKSPNRTQVELVTKGWNVGHKLSISEEFFSQISEQIVVFEKLNAFKIESEALRRKKAVDAADRQKRALRGSRSRRRRRR